MCIPIKPLLFSAFLLSFSLGLSSQKTKSIDFILNWETKTIGKDTFRVVTINGMFPGPNLSIQKKKSTSITIKNNLGEPTSIHFTGLQTNLRDNGDPFVNAVPIESGQTKTITLIPPEEGLFSYYGLMSNHKQMGLYGSLEVKSILDMPSKFDEELTLVLSDIDNKTADQIIKPLKRNSKWNEIKKKKINATWFDYIFNNAGIDRLVQSFNRIPAVAFHEFNPQLALLNGDTALELTGCEAGHSILLKIINASTFTNFDLKYSGGEMRLHSADGLPIDTQSVDRMQIGIGESYIVSINIPSDTLAYELKAQSFDGVLSTSVYFGEPKMIHSDSNLLNVRKIPVLNRYKTSSLKGVAWEDEMVIYQRVDTVGLNKLEQMGAQQDKYEAASKVGNVDSILRSQDMVLNYHLIKSPDSTNIDTSKPYKKVEMAIKGNMQRYVWDVDVKDANQKGQITVSAGDRIELVIDNKTPFFQPFHLHGHYFRMKNAQGKYAPFKHSINIKPLDRVTLEWVPNKSGVWAFDGNMLYRNHHGLSQEIAYDGQSKDADVLSSYQKDRKKFLSNRYNYGQISLLYNMLDFNFTSSTYKTAFNVDLESDYRYYFETDIDYSYYVGSNQYLSFFGGMFMNGGDNRVYLIDSNDVSAKFKVNPLGVIGMRYTLPLFINAEARLAHDLSYRFEFSGKIPLAPRTNIYYRANTDKEWQVMLEGRIIQKASLMFVLDYDYRFGIGGRWMF